MTAETDRGERERVQLNVRLERELVDELDDLARQQGSDRSDVARRLLARGLESERIESAIDRYAQGELTAWAAASAARISLYEILERIESRGVPYSLDPATLDRIRSRGHSARKREHGPAAGPADDFLALRDRFRAEPVRLLFIGESAPAGGTHFYRANSNLFRAMRTAFAEGLKAADVPGGPDFLAWFSSLGCWLVDAADEPVDDLEPSQRRARVRAGRDHLAAVIRDARPERIVVVKRDIAPIARAAVELAGLSEAVLDVVPFPLYQWRAQFVAQVGAIVREMFGAASDLEAGTRVAEDPPVYRTGDAAPTLHDAILTVLHDRGGGPARYRDIADEIASRQLWHRPSDRAVPRPGQIAARVRKYPNLFRVDDRGVTLRRPL